MPASQYIRQNVVNSILRAVALPLPANTYVSLHTADPGPTGANEVSTGTWPGYVRRDASNGVGGIASGWSAADTTGNSKNAKQITFPGNNATGPVTVTNFGIWDAVTGGNLIAYGTLTTSRTLAVGDILVFDVNSLSVTLT